MKKQERSKSKDIEKAGKILKSGGVVIFPTDTVFGIGCIIDDKGAIEKIYKIKGTEKSQHLPILISDISQIQEIAKLNSSALDLIKKHWPGALTLVLKTKAGSRTIGVRMPDSDTVRMLIKYVKKPIIGTSANFHAKPTPKKFEDLDPELIKLVDFVISGKCALQRESTVVDATADKIKILRQGAIKL